MMLTPSNRPRRGTTAPFRASAVADATAVEQHRAHPRASALRGGGADAASAGDHDVYWGTHGERRDSRETRRPDGPVAREFGAAEMPAGDWRQKQ
jgi:hypothetical protein